MNASHRRQLGLAVLVAVYFASFAVYPGLYGLIGVNHYGVWFLDFFALLASNDALSRGLDPYIGHALDYFNRPHIYSGWWLHLRDLGLTRADNAWMGCTLVVAFLLAACGRLRPQSWRELGWCALIVCSPPVVLAVNRANNDLVVFLLLAPVVPCLLSKHRAVRLVAVGLIAFATGLKFYPALAALVLLAGEDAREVRARLGLAGLALVLVGCSVAADYARLAPLLPKAHGLMTFAATNLFECAGLSARVARPASFVLAALVVLGFARSTIFSGWRIAPADRNAWLSFILGAVLLTGCFLAGTNYGYRWIFALWLAPLLWRLPRDPQAPFAVRRLAGAMAMLLPLALWADPLASALLTHSVGRVPGTTLNQVATLFFLTEQPLTWVFFGGLLGFLTHFVRTSLPPLALFRSGRQPRQPESPPSAAKG